MVGARRPGGVPEARLRRGWHKPEGRTQGRGEPEDRRGVTRAAALNRRHRRWAEIRQRRRGPDRGGRVTVERLDQQRHSFRAAGRPEQERRLQPDLEGAALVQPLGEQRELLGRQPSGVGFRAGLRAAVGECSGSHERERGELASEARRGRHQPWSVAGLAGAANKRRASRGAREGAGGRAAHRPRRLSSSRTKSALPWRGTGVAPPPQALSSSVCPRRHRGVTPQAGRDSVGNQGGTPCAGA